MPSLFLTMTTMDWITVSSMVIGAYVLRYYYNYFTRKNPLPGPIPFPFVGNLLQLGLDIPKVARHLDLKYGNISEAYFGSQRSIFVSGLDCVEKICSPNTSIKDNSFMYRIPPNEGFYEIGLERNGVVFNRDLKDWSINRRMLTQTLMSTGFLRGTIQLVEKNCDELFQYWDLLGVSANDNRTVIELPKWMKAFSNDLIIETILSKKSYAKANYLNRITDNKKLDIPQNLLKQSGEIIDNLSASLKGGMFIMNVPGYIRRSIFKYFNNKIIGLFYEVEEVFDKRVKERRQEIEAMPVETELPWDLLTLMITTNTSRDQNKVRLGEPLSDISIRKIIMELIVAGTYNIMSSISFVLAYLCNHPNVKDRLIEEIEQVYGVNSSPTITFESLDKLRYCEAVIHETARISPTNEVFFRTSSNQVELCGYTFEPDTLFWTNFYSLHHNENYWVEPEVFNPDRFLNNNLEKPKAFYQFGGGVRHCPGRFLVMVQHKIFLVRLFSKYDIESTIPNQPIIKGFMGGIITCEKFDRRLPVSFFLASVSSVHGSFVKLQFLTISKNWSWNGTSINEEFPDINLESLINNSDQSETRANEAADPIDVIINRVKEAVVIQAVVNEAVAPFIPLVMKITDLTKEIADAYDYVQKLVLARSITNEQLISILSSDIIEMKKFLDNIEGGITIMMNHTTVLHVQERKIVVKADKDKHELNFTSLNGEIDTIRYLNERSLNVRSSTFETESSTSGQIEPSELKDTAEPYKRKVTLGFQKIPYVNMSISGIQNHVLKGNRETLCSEDSDPIQRAYCEVIKLDLQNLSNSDFNSIIPLTPLKEGLVAHKKHDYNKAWKCFEEHAKAEDMLAKYWQGYYYSEGKYFLKYLKMSADNYNSTALYNLGEIYFNGRMGFEKDREKGIQYLTLAALQGQPKAKDVLRCNNIDLF
ncbi:2721_t:CDS:2 [Funneliformis caledonium]|uniref:2721_t:CDS:1 n=1 Tax=Funneliformis caledonium TaxID=1117310 RepID=A0A9N8WNP8_9GLOM|nr:2721_t:CDS:2 [Funneliformis caledonium]